MHVQPFVPFRSTFMDGISLIIASLAMTVGAADMALRILSASVVGGFTGPTLGDTGAAVLTGRRSLRTGRRLRPAPSRISIAERFETSWTSYILLGECTLIARTVEDIPSAWNISPVRRDYVVDP